MDDLAWMRRALEFAPLGGGWTSPNPLVGCVLVKGDQVVGEGYHARLGGPHAEVVALEMAGDRARGATAYVTLEPCAMCAGAIVLARVERLIYAADDPKAGACGSLYNIPQDSRLNHHLAITRGILADEAGQLLSEFFKAQRALGKK